MIAEHTKILCCKWHNRIPETVDKYSTPGFDECGLAGMGSPYVCCADCPEVDYFRKYRNMMPSDINFAKEIVEQS